MIAIDLSKQQPLGADPKAIQQIYFIGNQEEQSTIFVKGAVLIFLLLLYKIENVRKPLAKSVLIPLGLTAPASATIAAIQQKMFGSE